MKTLLSVALLIAFTSACTHGGHKRCKKGHHHKWEKSDANKDGKISKSEFDAMHSQKFNKMDSNKDGYIDMEEKKMMMKKKHHGHK